MNAAIFAEWLRRQGHHVVRTSSSYWYEVNLGVYQAFPYHWIIEPSDAELHQLFWKHRAIAVRFSTPLRARCGKVSYHVVCADPSYDLPCLSRQARQNVCKGLEHVRVERIPMSRLALEGWRMRQETLERQGRVDAETEEMWRRICTTAEDLPGFEAWGAIHKQELVASFLAFRCDDCFTLPYEQSASDHLKDRVNHAIFFGVTQAALRRPGVSEVFFCLESLDAPPSVDEFKFRMGYTAKPVRQRVVFHPLLAPLVNRTSYMMVKKMLAMYRHSSALAKVEGMFRFYLEGKRDLNRQDWPECLIPQKSELLAASLCGTPAQAANPAWRERSWPYSPC